MTVIQLKEKIIAKISATDNEELLEHISDLIDLEYNGVHQMSPGEIEAVNEGLEQLKSGKWISNEESNKRVDEWLKKYVGQ
ncbi:MAG: hypothetical protein JWP44_3243 [Mucilaginibacter sp.]|nr:hypothetical protein [Mucilaginibacter sp.]